MALALGIDLGTSKVAVALVDTDTRLPCHTVSRPTNADLPAGPDRAEQDPATILAVLDQAIADLPAAARSQVEHVGVAGQMHGVMLWNAASGETSRLITWQDQRGVADGFVEQLRRDAEEARLSSGYGWVTLAWLARYEPDVVARYDRAGTVMDYLVAHLAGLDQVATDAGNAHSWGFFNLRDRSWEMAAIERAGAPVGLAPTVVPSGAVVGQCQAAPGWGVPPTANVAVAIGDNPASLYATLAEPEAELALTLGTGGQLAAVLPAGAELAEAGDAVELRPYLDQRYMAVAASLCGGDAFAWLVQAASSWLRDLGATPPPAAELYQRLDQLGRERGAQGLRLDPVFAGERHDPQQRGRIDGMGLDNFDPGAVAAALAHGLVRHLKEMLPAAYLSGRRRVVGSGNGVRRLPLVQDAIEAEFGLPLVLGEVEEAAAVGAALFAACQAAPRGV